MQFIRSLHFNGYTVAILFAACVVSMVASFFLPGRIPAIDFIRVTLQRILLIASSHIYFGRVTLDNEGRHIPGGDIITFDMLLPKLRELKTGDIFLTESAYYLSAAITPGKWKHAGIYLGDLYQVRELFGMDSDEYKYIARHFETGDEVLILDSSKIGVTIRDIRTMSGLDSASFLRSFAGFNCNSEDVGASLIKCAIGHIGKEYDYDLRLDEEKNIYCAQLVYDALREQNIDISPSGKYLGRAVLKPQDIYNFCETADTLFEKAMELHAEGGRLYDETEDLVTAD